LSFHHIIDERRWGGETTVVANGCHQIISEAEEHGKLPAKYAVTSSGLVQIKNTPLHMPESLTIDMTSCYIIRLLLLFLKNP